MEREEEALRRAISQFWATRLDQGKHQGKRRGKKDYGQRAAVTGGKQMNGFVDLFTEVTHRSGLKDAVIHAGKATLHATCLLTSSRDSGATVTMKSRPRKSDFSSS